MSPDRPLLIFGLGNLLLCDDGVGVHAAQALAVSPPGGVQVLDIGTAVFHALSFLRPDSRVLAIDAMHAGGAPGTRYLINGREADTRQARGSVHAIGLGAVLRGLPGCGESLEWLLLGVEPAEIRYGMQLSPALRTALPAVIATARSIAGLWRATPLSADRFLDSFDRLEAQLPPPAERRTAP